MVIAMAVTVMALLRRQSVHRYLAALRRECAALRASNHEKDDTIRTNDDDLRLLMDFAIMSWGRERLVAAFWTSRNL